MRSFIKIALLLFYVFFNAGLSYSLHFCGEDFQRINVFAEYKTCCESNTPMQGCCDDVSNLEFPNSDQRLSEILDFEFQVFELPTVDAEWELPVFSIALGDKTSFADSSYPKLQNTPIYIFCQEFLI